MSELTKYKSVKNELFKGFDEQEIIDNQKFDKDEETPLADKPLGTLFGFYEAAYYLKEITLDDEKILEVHLISDKPFSKDEISILKVRLLVIYNQKYDIFRIFQEPEDDVDSNAWLKKRKLFETNLDSKNMEDPVYRIIGKITEFRTDRSIHTYKITGIQVKPKYNKKDLTKSQITNMTFHKILKRMMQGKNFADFWVKSIDSKEDNITGGIMLTIYITSKDDRISSFFENKDSTTTMFQELFKGITSAEVINMKDLED